MTAYTTLKTLTGSMIHALRTEAAAAGDSAMVAICNRASAGSVRAQRAVVKAIRAAEASAQCIAQMNAR